MNPKRRHRTGITTGITVGFLATALLLGGCVAPDPDAHPVSPSPASPTPTTAVSKPSSTSATAGPSADGTPAGIAHVVLIVMENESVSNILGNDEAPYINKLASEYAVATNYRAITHPSLPNYLALTSGTNAGITDDCEPGDGCTAKVPNITDTIGKSGRSWKMYAESMPAPCAVGNTELYAVRHNPFMYYPGITDSQASCKTHVVPLQRLAADLETTASTPNYVFISPNVCNDTHDCPLDTGDAWLSKQVPQILHSPAFTTQNSLLVLTWDEGGDHDGTNTVATIFSGPAARQGSTSTREYTHYSLLHTIERAWGLSPLTPNDRNAPTMEDMLN